MSEYQYSEFQPLALLLDLKALAEQRGNPPDFAARLAAIGHRHARKPRSIERLTAFR